MNNIKISVCSNYDYTKDKAYNNNKVSGGWSLIDVPWTHADIALLFTTNGTSASEFMNGNRVNTAWYGSYGVMLDFDNGIMSSQRLLQMQSSFTFNSFLFTSQNHMRQVYDKNGQPKPVVEKLRLYIPFVNPITNETDRLVIKQILIHTFGSALDTCFMDRTRYFAHGRTDSGINSFVDAFESLDFHKIPGYALHNEQYKKSKDRPKRRYTMQEIEEISFHLDDNTRDEHGRPIKMRDIKPGDKFHCPKCIDNPDRTNHTHNATMFVAEDSLPMIYCSSCDSRDMGKGASGIYMLHQSDHYEYMILERREFVFEAKDSCKDYGIEFNKEGKPIFRELPTRDNIINFCADVKIPMPHVLPRMEYDLRFNSNKIIDFEEKFVNKYIPTELITLQPIPGIKHDLPYLIGKTLRHICGDDDEMTSKFIKWLAYLIQYRCKMITTFLFQGTEGTGKGITFNNIIAPIIGEQYCADADQDRFGNQFNSFLSEYLLVLVNEVHMNDGDRDRSGIEKIKQAISDTAGMVERKGKDVGKEVKVCSFLFATNGYHGVILSKNDRRFNVCPRQSIKIHDTEWFGGHEQWLLSVKKELPEFVRYLKSLTVTHDEVTRTISNAAKRKLQEMSTTTSEDFFVALKAGDYDYFDENLVPETNMMERYNQARASLLSMKNMGYGTTADLAKIYNFMYKKDLSPAAYGKVMSLYINIDDRQTVRINGEPKKVYKINWKKHE